MKRTQKIRVALVVDEHGNWGAAGRSPAPDEELHDSEENSLDIARDLKPHKHGAKRSSSRIYWLTAEVPAPAPELEVKAQIRRPGGSDGLGDFKGED